MQKKKEGLLSKSISLYVLLIYFVLSLIITFPLIFHFKDYVIGNQYTDVWQNLWSFSRIEKCLLERESPFFTIYRGYPLGGKFYPVELFNALLSVPLQVIFNLTIAYNVSVICLMILGGYGAYCLVAYLTGNRIAGFVSGIIYGFSSCQISWLHNGTTQLLNIGWIPLFILYLLKSLKEKGYTKNLLLAAIFLFLSAFSSWSLGLFACMFMVLLFLYYLFFKRRTEFNLINTFKMFLVFLLFVLLISPFAYLVHDSILGTNDVNMIVEKSPDGSLMAIEEAEFSNLIDYFRLIPFGVKSQRITRLLKITPFSLSSFYIHGVYIGYFVLFLTLLGCSSKEKRKQTGFWISAAIFFFILSLGPYLHLSGREPMMIAGHKIPLPYLVFFKFVPFFWLMTSPSRFMIMVFLCLSVVVGFGLSEALRKLNRGYQHVMSVFISFLIVSEYLVFSPLPYPLPINSTDVSSYYYKLAKEKGEFAIIEVPIKHWYFSKGKGSYAQSIHGKRVVYGISGTSRPLPYITKTNSFAKYLAYLEDALPTAVSFSDIDLKHGLNGLKGYGFRYIIVHNNLLDKDSSEDVHQFLKKFLGKPNKYEDNIVVYMIQ